MRLNTQYLAFYLPARAGKKRGRETPPVAPKFMKTRIQKMSDFDLSTMLMKTRKLYASFHDVDDKKET